MYALQYIVCIPLQKLYSFTVRPEILSQLDRVVGRLMEQALDRKIKSQEMLELMAGG